VQTRLLPFFVGFADSNHPNGRKHSLRWVLAPTANKPILHYCTTHYICRQYGPAHCRTAILLLENLWQKGKSKNEELAMNNE
jgi:hypothetical protein